MFNLYLCIFYHDLYLYFFNAFIYIYTFFTSWIYNYMNIKYNGMDMYFIFLFVILHNGAYI